MSEERTGVYYHYECTNPDCPDAVVIDVRTIGVRPSPCCTTCGAQLEWSASTPCGSDGRARNPWMLAPRLRGSEATTWPNSKEAALRKLMNLPAASAASSIMDATPDLKAKALDQMEKDCRRLTIESEAALRRDMTPDKPSIAELQRAVATGYGWPNANAIAINRAAPLLLEIVAAALAWRDQRVENLHAALMRTETEIEAEAQNVQRARVKRTADLARALEAALAKVTP